MPHDLTDDKSTLLQVMAWYRQTTSHYLNQCWPRSPTPYGVTRPQWAKVSPYHTKLILVNIKYNICNFSTLRLRRKSKYFILEDIALSITQIGYNWWWHGDAKTQGISNKVIYRVTLEYVDFGAIWVNIILLGQWNYLITSYWRLINTANNHNDNHDDGMVMES